MPTQPTDARNKLLALLAAAALAVVGITIVVSDDDGDGKPDRTTITIELGGHDQAPAGVPAGPATLELGETGQAVLEQAKDTELGGHDGLVNETPGGLPAAAGEKLPLYLERNAESNTLPDLSPLAAPEQAGCRSRFVSNQSSRAGVRPRVIVAHYTVSPNRPGFSDVDGITAYFNSARSSASSHYVIDADGNCNYIVPETAKAWTQAAGNPYSIAIEHIAVGNERYLATPAGYRKSGQVYAAIAKRWDIPIQRGAVNRANCVPTRAGIIQHFDFGACGGGHHDVTPFALAKLIAAAKAAAKPPCGKRCRAIKRQQRVVAGRKAKHAATHRSWLEARCRNRRHPHRANRGELTRRDCVRLKRRDRLQRAGIRRAKAKLGNLR